MWQAQNGTMLSIVLPGTSYMHLIPSLNPFTTYSVTVYATNKVGRGRDSNPVNITTDPTGTPRVGNGIYLYRQDLYSFHDGHAESMCVQCNICIYLHCIQSLEPELSQQAESCGHVTGSSPMPHSNRCKSIITDRQLHVGVDLHITQPRPQAFRSRLRIVNLAAILC